MLPVTRGQVFLDQTSLKLEFMMPREEICHNCTKRIFKIRLGELAGARKAL